MIGHTLAGRASEQPEYRDSEADLAPQIDKVFIQYGDEDEDGIKDPFSFFFLTYRCSAACLEYK